MTSIIDKETYQSYEEKMQKALNHMQSELHQIRAGRANPRILDQVSVDYYGTPTPLNQVANITVPEARQLLIQPWDKSILSDVEKALYAANLGITPNNEGDKIRLTFPPLTEERRRDLTREVDKLAEEAKVTIRHVRRDFIDEVKKREKNKEISEDELHQAETEIQDLTDKFTDKADEMASSKNEELMEV